MRGRRGLAWQEYRGEEDRVKTRAFTCNLLPIDQYFDLRGMGG
jgi:hypothetical protein